MFLGLDLSEVGWFASVLNAVTEPTRVLFKTGFPVLEMHIYSLSGLHYRKNRPMENAANCRSVGDFTKRSAE